MAKLIELKEMDWTLIYDEDGVRLIDHVGNIVVRGESLRDLIRNFKVIIEQKKEH